VSRAQISLIENGKADPRLSTVEKLLSSYGASLADLEPVRVRVPTIDEVSERAQQAASRLYEMGLGPSDPLARLDLKRSRGADTESERQALATRP
jgi:transcriptional regulator with XRE-family HTH domain